jgi:molecular chaperone GrpE
MTERIDEESLLNQFRQWLEAARDEHSRFQPSAPEPENEVGLIRLVEEFTALRHEVKLHTKGSRGLQEQTESVLPLLKQAIAEFKSVEPREAQAAISASKPLVEALADLDEALNRGKAELDKAVRLMMSDPNPNIVESLDSAYQSQSWIKRILTRNYHMSVRELVVQVTPSPRKALLEALIEGYGLIQARLRRAMEAEHLRPIESVGQAVDPDLMTVIEVVEDSTLPPHQVIAEIRRGYTWRGRVLRYAEVRSTRSHTYSINPDLGA